MSFMFNPSPYDEWSAMNRPVVCGEKVKISKGIKAVASTLVNDFTQKSVSVFALDGYATAEFKAIVE